MMTVTMIVVPDLISVMPTAVVTMMMSSSVEAELMPMATDETDMDVTPMPTSIPSVVITMLLPSTSAVIVTVMSSSATDEKEDNREFMLPTNLSDDDDPNINSGGGRLPSFCGVNAGWTSVRDFCRVWDSFSSHLSYSFASRWNLSDTT